MTPRIVNGTPPAVLSGANNGDCTPPAHHKTAVEGSMLEIRRPKTDGKAGGQSSCCEHCGSSVNEQALRLLKDMGLLKGSPPSVSAADSSSHFLRMPSAA